MAGILEWAMNFKEPQDCFPWLTGHKNLLETLLRGADQASGQFQSFYLCHQNNNSWYDVSSYSNSSQFINFIMKIFVWCVAVESLLSYKKLFYIRHLILNFLNIFHQICLIRIQLRSKWLTQLLIHINLHLKSVHFIWFGGIDSTAFLKCFWMLFSDWYSWKILLWMDLGMVRYKNRILLSLLSVNSVYSEIEKKWI